MTKSTEGLNQRYLAAQGVAREAGAIMKRRFDDRSSFTLGYKGHQDYITEVDGQIERLVIDRLGGAFAGDGFIGEEGGGTEADSLWVIDPIDGTANFARGIPHFCISIAHVSKGIPDIGVIYDPVCDEMFAAMRGRGAWLNGARMAVSGTSDMRSANIEIGWNMRSGMDSFLDVVQKIVATGSGMIRSGSGALGVAYVAAGRIDGYCETHINAWDVLAGIVLVQEAGGLCNDFLAGGGLRRGNPILACTPALAPVLAEVSGIAL